MHYHEQYAFFLKRHKDKLLYRDYHHNLSLKSSSLSIKDIPYCNLSSNDYLGFAFREDIINHATDIAHQFGAGSTSSRAVTAQYNYYYQIEKKLAKFKKREAALIGASGFQVNSTVISALLTPFPNAEIFFDKANHASLYFGLKHAGIAPIRYVHNHLDHLEALIQKSIDKNPDLPRFIITESLFSMDGDFCPLADLYAIAQKYKCFTIIDDAHAVGVYGENGTGLASAYAFDIILGTCSKAFGSFGGYVAGDNVIIDYIRQFAGGFIYSTALPPFIWGAIDKVLDITPNANAEREKILHQIKEMQALCTKYHIHIGESKSHIIPLIAGDNARALLWEKHFHDHRFYIKAIRSPTVPAGTARLRLSLTACLQQDISEKIEYVIKSL